MFIVKSKKKTKQHTRAVGAKQRCSFSISVLKYRFVSQPISFYF